MTILLVLGALLLSVALSAFGAWIIWLIYNAVAPALGLPPLDFLIIWGVVFLLRLIFMPVRISKNS